MWSKAYNGPSLHPPHREKEWVPPQEQERKKAERADETRRRYERSDRVRYKAMIKKFGLKEAVRLGVPQAFSDDLEAKEAREAARQAKNEATRQRKKQLRLRDKSRLVRVTSGGAPHEGS